MAQTPQYRPQGATRSGFTFIITTLLFIRFLIVQLHKVLYQGKKFLYLGLISFFLELHVKWKVNQRLDLFIDPFIIITHFCSRLFWVKIEFLRKFEILKDVPFPTRVKLFWNQRPPFIWLILIQIMHVHFFYMFMNYEHINIMNIFLF